MTLPASLIKISDTLWELPVHHKAGMRGGEDLCDSSFEEMDDAVFDQITSISQLPVRHALCMPDAHWGYRFPIGVAAMDPTRVISREESV